MTSHATETMESVFRTFLVEKWRQYNPTYVLMDYYWIPNSVEVTSMEMLMEVPLHNLLMVSFRLPNKQLVQYEPRLFMIPILKELP